MPPTPRLRRDRPDIHQRVLAGEIAAHAGMVPGALERDETPRAAGALF
jgi:hypothetical protein